MVDDRYVGNAVRSHLAEIRADEPLMRNLYEAFGRMGEMALLWADWISLAATVRAFEPDLVLELGRGLGTSTAVFRLSGMKVVSVCNSHYWTTTARALSEVVPLDWTENITAIIADINDQDYAALIGDADRVFVFWDAHGNAIADTVFSKLLPVLHGRDVLVACHDMRDNRFMFGEIPYGDNPLWRSQDDPGNAAWVHLGTVYSTFDQVVPIVDFTSRNRIPLCSATYSLMIDQNAKSAFCGPQWPYCLWHYFELPTRELTFPAQR